MAVASVTGGFTELGNPITAPSAGDYIFQNSSSDRTYDSNNDQSVLTTGFSTVANQTMGSIVNISSFDFTVARRLLYGQIDFIKYLSTYANGSGLMIALYSDSYNNERVFRIAQGAGTASTLRVAKNSFVIKPTRTHTALRDDAGFTLSAVTRIGVGTRIGVAAGFLSNYFSQIGYIDPYILLNGTSGAPGNFKTFTAAMIAQGVMPIISPTENLHYCKNSWIIGNGSTETHFSDSIKTWEFVSDFLSTELNILQSTVGENDVGMEINASALDVISFAICTWLSTNKYFWNVLGSTSATVSFNSCLIKNAGEITIVDGPTFEAVTFDGCDRLNTTAPTMNNGIIKNSTDTHAIDLVDTANLTNMQIFGNATAMLFDFDGSATVTFDNLIFSDNTVDVEYTGSGVLTIVAINGTVVTTTNASGTGSIEVTGAIVEQGLSFTALQTDSQVIIYQTGTTTVIDSDESTTTAYEWKITYTADQTVDYTILKEGYLTIRVTGLALSNTVVPVPVQQVADRTYATSSGLTYGTNVVIDTGAKTVTVSAATTGQNLRNALIEFWRAQTALRNVQFPAITNGPNSITMIEDWEIVGVSYLSRDGLRYTDTDGVMTAQWAAILSIGSVTGLTAEYQQVESAAATNAAASGVVDQLIQVYGDATHGNFDYTGYLYIKYQPNGYAEAGLNVVDQYGTLEDQLYVVGIQPTLLSDLTAGDPAITGVTVTNHGASPVTWNSKDFSVTITDTGSNTGEAIWRWINYNKSLDATFQSIEPFNLFDMVLNAGDTYETQRGTIIGSAGALLKGVRVVDGAGEPHSYFARFQADDGTYYTPPAQILLEAPNLEAGRIQLYNVTTLTEIDNSLVTDGYNTSWINGTDITAGDICRLTWASDLGDKDAIVNTFVAPASGTQNIIDEPVTDTVFAQYTGLLGVGGADITEFIPDFPNLQLDINTGPGFKVMRMYIYYKYILSSEDGIRLLIGAITPIDAGKLLIDVTKVPFNLDSLATMNVYQEDSVVIIRSDGAPVPVSQPTGGYGISMIHNGTPVVFSTSDGLSVSDYNLIASIAASVSGLATSAELSSLATSAELAGIAQAGDLAPLAKTSDLTPLAKTIDLVGLATAEDLVGLGDATEAKQDQIIAAQLTAAQIADGILVRNIAGGSNGGRMIKDALRANRNKVVTTTDSITVYEEDDTTIAWVGVLTRDEYGQIISVDPA